jgi:hypothetical protein
MNYNYGYGRRKEGGGKGRWMDVHDEEIRSWYGMVY